MREVSIIGQFDAIKNYIVNLENQLKIAFSGEALRAQALQNVLIRKGVVTETELTEELGAVIKKLNEAPTAKTAELAKPTAEDVANVAKSTTDEAPKQ